MLFRSERGVNLLTYKVKSSDGRNIAAYKFGKPVFLDDTLYEIKASVDKELEKLCQVPKREVCAAVLRWR